MAQAKSKSERWATIPGWPNHEISTKGRLRVLRYSNRWGAVHYIQVQLQPRKSGSTRAMVYLYEGNKHWHVSVGKLMLMTFVRLPHTNEVARHLDDNHLHNDLSNLAWGTPKQNKADAIRNGRMWLPDWIGAKGEAHINSKLTEKDVKQIRKLHIPRHNKFGTRSLARRFGVSNSAIQHVVEYKNWKHVP